MSRWSLSTIRFHAKTTTTYTNTHYKQESKQTRSSSERQHQVDEMKYTRSRWPNRMMSMHLIFWKEKCRRKRNVRCEAKAFILMSSLKLMGSHQTAKQRLFRSCCCFIFSAVRLPANSCSRSFRPNNVCRTLFVAAASVFYGTGITSSKSFNILLSRSTISHSGSFTDLCMHTKGGFKFEESQRKKNSSRTLNFALSPAPNFQHFDSMSRCSHFN